MPLTTSDTDAYFEALRKWKSDGGLRPVQRPDGIPTRVDLGFMTPAEIAIGNAMRAVEDAGGSPALTDAIMLLSGARARVADHVEGNRAVTTLQVEREKAANLAFCRASVGRSRLKIEEVTAKAFADVTEADWRFLLGALDLAHDVIASLKAKAVRDMSIDEHGI